MCQLNKFNIELKPKNTVESLTQGLHPANQKNSARSVKPFAFSALPFEIDIEIVNWRSLKLAVYRSKLISIKKTPFAIAF